MSTFERVRAIVAEEFDVPESRVTEAASFDGDLQADSLMKVELVMALEDEFRVEIPEDEAQQIQTVGDAVRYLEARTAPSQG
ncbi:MAG: acyl carrier protein [Armatimonadota bacterium]